MTDNTRRDAAKDKDIVSYLKSKGITPVRVSGANAYYYSPIKAERNPSMVVNIHRNRWKLFNESNKGGDIIELVMLLEDVTFPKALDMLLGERSVGKHTRPQGDFLPQDTPKGIEVIKTSEIQDIGLIEYALSRKIDLPVLHQFCKEVHIRFPNSNKNPHKIHICIGFFNDSGGAEFRNTYLKVSNSPKDITTLKWKGKESYVFEGFFNMLAMFSYFGIKSLPGRVYILNGAGQAGVLAEFIRGKHIFGYLDNDNASNGIMDTFLDKDVRVTDCRIVYKEYNDFNDFVIDRA